MKQRHDPQDPTHSQESEVHSGSQAFGFFHKHQKVIIYTAGIFTLLTFSVTGALLGTADRLFGRGYKGPTMNVPGVGEVEVSEADLQAAKGISRVRAGGAQLMVFPQMNFGDDGDVQYIDQLAALHAVAVKTGIDASGDDVEAVIQAAIQTYPNVNSVEELAYAARTNDVEQFRKWVRQSLRVANYLRLAGLAVERTDEAVVQEILKDNERVSFDVAYVDAEAYKKSLEKDLTDEVLKKYLEELDDVKAEKYRKPANRSAIRIAMLEFDAFEPETYLGVELDRDLQVGDNEVQDRYIRDREEFYKLPAKDQPAKDQPAKDQPAKDQPATGDGKGEAPKDGTKKPDAVKQPDTKNDDGTKKTDGDTKKTDGDTKKNDEEKGNGSLDPLAQDPPKQDPPKPDAGKPDAGKPDAGKPDAGKPDAEKQGAAGTKPGDLESAGAGDAAAQDTPEYRNLDDDLRARIRKQILAEKVLAKWLGQLDLEMARHMEAVINAATAAEIAVEDAKEALADAETELEKKVGDAELEKKVAGAKTKVDAAKVAAKAAKQKVDAQRKTFDFEATVRQLANGRKGLVIVTVAEMKDAEGLREIEGVGEWKDSHLPGQMTLAGEIYNGRVQNTAKGAFIFQVTDIEERPFKPFADIKSEVQTQYLTEKSEAYVKEKKETFEKVLERLARAKLVDEIAKIEKDASGEIEKKFNEWKTTLENDIKDLEAQVATMDPSLRAYKGLTATRDEKQAELAKADEKRKSIKEAIDADTKDAVAKKLAEVHKDVMAEAAKEAGFAVEVIGPYSRKLQDRPRFKHEHPNIVQALFGNAEIAGYDAGETTGLEDDPLNEVVFMAACKEVEKGQVAQLSRRQWLATRTGGAYGSSFAGERLERALNQSFTLDALKKRFDWAAPKSIDRDKPVIGLEKTQSPDKDTPAK